MNPANFRERGIPVLLGTLVVLAHLSVGWILVHQTNSSIHTERPATPLTIIALPRTASDAISTSFISEPIHIDPIVPNEPIFHVVDPDTAAAPPASPHGITIPPHPEAPLADTKSFARQAGLEAGVGVTVVLRVEVRGNGAVGRVQIDVSGGSQQIDDAAIAFIRSIRWIGGRTDNEPETFWIRWGVRLDG